MILIIRKCVRVLRISGLHYASVQQFGYAHNIELCQQVNVCALSSMRIIVEFFFFFVLQIFVLLLKKKFLV